MYIITHIHYYAYIIIHTYLYMPAIHTHIYVYRVIVQVFNEISQGCKIIYIFYNIVKDSLGQLKNLESDCSLMR